MGPVGSTGIAKRRPHNVARLTRRLFLQNAAATSALAALYACGGGSGGANSVAPYYGPTSSTLPPPPAMLPDALVSDAQQRTFRYFWETTEATRGLAPDIAPESSPASIAAMGFALTAVPIGPIFSVGNVAVDLKTTTMNCANTTTTVTQVSRGTCNGQLPPASSR